MAAKIGGKGGGGGSTIQVEPLSVTHNGTYTPDTGKAYGPVDVNVAAPIPTSMVLTATQNGQYAPNDHGVEYFNHVTVAVPTPAVGSLSDIISTSGIYDYFPSSYGYEYFDHVGIQVDVIPPEPPTPTTLSLVVDANGEYQPLSYDVDYFSDVTVSVPGYKWVRLCSVPSLDDLTDSQISTLANTQGHIRVTATANNIYGDICGTATIFETDSTNVASLWQTGFVMQDSPVFVGFVFEVDNITEPGTTIYTATVSTILTEINHEWVDVKSMFNISNLIFYILQPI